MIPLPAPQTLAGLVTNVTQTMLGIRFAPDAGSLPAATLCWRTAVLPIPGSRPISVGLSSDETGCRALSAAMFSCAPSAVDASMVEDSLGELVNMTAGLVKNVLSLDQALGLPRIVPPSELSHVLQPPTGQAVVLRASGLGLFLWVCEGVVPCPAS